MRLFQSKSSRQKSSRQLTSAQLAYLDAHLYPLSCQDFTFDSPKAVLLAIINSHKNDNNYLNNNNCPDNDTGIKQYFADLNQAQIEFSQTLQHNAIYQEWINFTVFGRYIQRSFAAFYKQSEDVFNADMPKLLKQELMRHAQRLPKHQYFFFAGQLPASTRQEKLIICSLSPFYAYQQAQHHCKQKTLIINFIKIGSDSVLGFAVKHNSRTSERFRHEVMLLDFHDLRLIREDIIDVKLTTPPTIEQITLRYYSVK